MKYLTKTPCIKRTTSATCNNIPICPVINNNNYHTYQVAKFLPQKLNDYLNFSNQYFVSHSIKLAQDLTKFMFKGNKKIITYDIEEHFVNILIQKIINISENFRQLKVINQISKKKTSFPDDENCAI